MKDQKYYEAKILRQAKQLVETLKKAGYNITFDKGGVHEIPVSVEVMQHTNQPLAVRNLNNGWEVKGNAKQLSIK